MQTIKSHCLMKVGQERKIRQYDAFALEDHFHEATSAERGRWQRNWKIVFIKEGVEGKIRQRPDFREAKHTYRRLYKKHVESTGQGNKSIHPAQQRRENSQQQFDEHAAYACRMNGSRIKVRIFGDLQPGLISKKFLRSKSSAQGNLSHC